MPWESAAQARWGHSPAGVQALGGQSAVAEWDAATAGRKLPKRKGRASAERVRRGVIHALGQKGGGC